MRTVKYSRHRWEGLGIVHSGGAWSQSVSCYRQCPGSNRWPWLLPYFQGLSCLLDTEDSEEAQGIGEQG